jgi:hypothetical protein
VLLLGLTFLSSLIGPYLNENLICFVLILFIFFSNLNFNLIQMGLLATSNYVLASLTTFSLISMALFYTFTGRGAKIGNIKWLLEGNLIKLNLLLT